MATPTLGDVIKGYSEIMAGEGRSFDEKTAVELAGKYFKKYGDSGMSKAVSSKYSELLNSAGQDAADAFLKENDSLVFDYKRALSGEKYEFDPERGIKITAPNLGERKQAWGGTLGPTGDARVSEFAEAFGADLGVGGVARWLGGDESLSDALQKEKRSTALGRSNIGGFQSLALKAPGFAATGFGVSNPIMRGIASPLVKAASPIARGVAYGIEGAGYGAASTAGEAMAGEDTHFLRNVLMGGFGGAAGGLAVPAAINLVGKGAGAAASKAGAALEKLKSTKIGQEILSRIGRSQSPDAISLSSPSRAPSDVPAFMRRPSVRTDAGYLASEAELPISERQLNPLKTTGFDELEAGLPINERQVAPMPIETGELPLSTAQHFAPESIDMLPPRSAIQAQNVAEHYVPEMPKMNLMGSLGGAADERVAMAANEAAMGLKPTAPPIDVAASHLQRMNKAMQAAGQKESLAKNIRMKSTGGEIKPVKAAEPKSRIRKDIVTAGKKTPELSGIERLRAAAKKKGILKTEAPKKSGVGSKKSAAKKNAGPDTDPEFMQFLEESQQTHLNKNQKKDVYKWWLLQREKLKGLPQSDEGAVSFDELKRQEDSNTGGRKNPLYTEDHGF